MAETPTPHAEKKSTPTPNGRDDVIRWSVLLKVGGIVSGFVVAVASVLVAYYTAEAAQNIDIKAACSDVASLKQQQADLRQKLDSTFDKFDRTMTAQQMVIAQTREAVVRAEATQTSLQQQTLRLSDQIDKLTTGMLHKP